MSRRRGYRNAMQHNSGEAREMNALLVGALGLCALFLPFEGLRVPRPELQPTKNGQSEVLAALRDARPSLRNYDIRAVYDFAAAPDGGLYFVDGRWPRLVALSADGEIRWQHNRRGIGPGEFSFPYRMALSTNFEPVVLDLGSRDLLWFRSDGTFVRRTNLGLPFAVVSDFAVLAADRVLIAGVTTDPRGAGRALHAFSREMGWLRSFVDLPELPADVLRLWGVGSITLTSGSSVLFAPKTRGGVLEVSFDGIVTRRLKVDDSGLTNPTDFFKISQNNSGGSQVTFSDSLVAPGQAIALARGHVLTSRMEGTNVRLTEYSGSGRPIGSLVVGQSGLLPFAFDSVSCRLWVRRRSKAGLALGQLPVGLAIQRVVSTHWGLSDAKNSDGVGCAPDGGGHTR